MYSYTLSLTSAVDGVGGQRHAPAVLPPQKEIRYPFYRRLGGPLGPVWTGASILNLLQKVCRGKHFSANSSLLASRTKGCKQNFSAMGDIAIPNEA